ncbi:mannosyl-3-phosphoglycerate phosphatase [hot springs metagenome]|uniref:Mannosyl-3-phosphoglycerate phosphatase n=1 Tax=hot springs metagenome TaxID=433727 RepID=A0A5J4L2I9_9ZZZZ
MKESLSLNDRVSLAEYRREIALERLKGGQKIIIFTDLDGTLLDAETYSFEPALPALTLLKKKDIPLIICSSKTRKEIEYYRKKLDNHHPFISENGGGIFIPSGYFKFQTPNFKYDKDSEYLIIKLGARYSDLRKAIIELREEGFNVKGFGDMTVEEVSKITGLAISEAKMAKERDFDEPFIFKGDTKRLFNAINAKGFNYTQGAFYHILGDSDKGKAVSILIDLYRKSSGDIKTIAIGDSLNDLPMLKNVDYPILVKKIDNSYDKKINLSNLIRADGIGPEGWNKAVLKIISAY